MPDATPLLTTLLAYAGALPAQASEFSLEAPSGTRGQFMVTVSIVAIIVTTAIAFWLKSDYAGLKEVVFGADDHLSALRRSRRTQSPRTYRYPISEDLSEHAAAIRATIHGRDIEQDRDWEEVEEETRTTARESVAEMHDALQRAVAPFFGGVPKLVLWFGEVGLGVLLTGALALAAKPIANAIAGTGGGGGLSLSVVLDAIGTGATALFDLATAFPYAGQLWQLVFTLAVMSVEWVYHHGWLLGIGLLLGGLALYYLDRRLPEFVEPTVFRYPSGPAIKTVGAILAIWATGTIFGLLATVVPSGFSGPLTLVGFLASVLVAVYFAYHGAGALRARVRQAASLGVDATAPDRWVLGYIVVRNVGILLLVLALPLIPIYTVILLVEGSLGTVIGAFAAASPGVQGVAALVLLGTVVAFFRVTASGWRDLRSAIAEGLSRQAVRATLFQRTLPGVSFVFGYVLGYNLTQSIPLGVVAAVVFAVGLRLIYGLLIRAHENARLRDSTNNRPNNILIQAYDLENAGNVGNGDVPDEHAYVRLGSTEDYWHEDREQLAETVLDAIEEMADPEGDGKPSPTLEAWAADKMFQTGMVRFERAEKALDERLRKIIWHTLRKEDGSATLSTLEDELEDYPRERWHPDEADTNLWSASDMAEQPLVHQWVYRDGDLDRNGNTLVIRRDTMRGLGT